MADPNQIWAQGDELSLGARQLNMWTRGAQLAHQALGGGSSDPLASAPLFTPLRIRNATGEQIPRLGVVWYRIPTVVPVDDEHRFIHSLTVNAFAPNDPVDRFAICLEPIADNGIGIAAIGGVVPCRITGEGDLAEAIFDDMTKLQAGSTGYEILWQESGTEERYATILLGAQPACPNKVILSIWGNPVAGTFTLRQSRDVDTDTVLEFDATIEEIEAALELANGYDPEADPVVPGNMIVTGGPLPNNDVTITMPRGWVLQTVLDDLTQAGSIVPHSRVSSCCG